jgi:hypothetical protein
VNFFAIPTIVITGTVNTNADVSMQNSVLDLATLDTVLRLQSLYTPAWALVALAIGIIGGIGNLLARRPVAAA